MISRFTGPRCPTSPRHLLPGLCLSLRTLGARRASPLGGTTAAFRSAYLCTRQPVVRTCSSWNGNGSPKRISGTNPRILVAPRDCVHCSNHPSTFYFSMFFSFYFLTQTNTSLRVYVTVPKRATAQNIKNKNTEKKRSGVRDAVPLPIPLNLSPAVVLFTSGYRGPLPPPRFPSPPSFLPAFGSSSTSWSLLLFAKITPVSFAIGDGQSVSDFFSCQGAHPG